MDSERNDFSQDKEAEITSKNINNEPLPPYKPYLWTSAHSAHEDKEFKFSGFEPCYIACIKSLEHQIKRKIQGLDLKQPGDHESPEAAEEIEPLLLRYSEMIEALDGIQKKDRDFNDDILRPNDQLTRFSGEKRILSRNTEHDTDRAYSHLRNNLILVVLGYIYTWSLADDLKKRFGNITTTLDRLIVGIAGGASLLIPMIIMTFVPSRDARLIVVCCFTVGFAVGVSLMKITREGVIAAVAAYAAIMVVYIGSSDTSGS